MWLSCTSDKDVSLFKKLTGSTVKLKNYFPWLIIFELYLEWGSTRRTRPFCKRTETDLLRAPAGSTSCLFPSEQRKQTMSTRQMLPAIAAGFFSGDGLSEMIRRNWEGDRRKEDMASETTAERCRELTAGFPMQRSEMSWQRILTAMQEKGWE